MTSLADRQLEQWAARMVMLNLRQPKEWIGKTPESMPPPRIRDRVVLAFGGKCARSGVEIRPGVTVHMDHIVPLADGGMNAERNLQPLVDKAHRAKTAQENRERAQAAAKRRAMAGNKAAPTKKIESRGFAKVVKSSTVGKARIDKSALPPLPRRGVTP